jgi:predicted transcriptional regulator
MPMRNTHTMTISLPPAMVEEFEKVRKTENRTKSELVREALRHYFARRIPVVSASDEELAAIKRGQFVTLEQLLQDLAPQNRKAGRKRA